MKSQTRRCARHIETFGNPSLSLNMRWWCPRLLRIQFIGELTASVFGSGTERSKVQILSPRSSEDAREAGVTNFGFFVGRSVRAFCGNLVLKWSRHTATGIVIFIRRTNAAAPSPG